MVNNYCIVTTTTRPNNNNNNKAAAVKEDGKIVISRVLCCLLMLEEWIVLVQGGGGGGIVNSGGGGFGSIVVGGGYWGLTPSNSNVGLALAVTAIALAATLVYSRRGSLKSPWSRRRRKHALQPKQWRSFFNSDGKLNYGGVRFLKKVRSGGVDPSIRAEVWPFLLGVFELNSTKDERDSVRTQKRKEYENLQKQCRQIRKRPEKSSALKETSGNCISEVSGELSQVFDSMGLEDVDSGRRSSTDGESQTLEDSELPVYDQSPQSSGPLLEEEADKSDLTHEDTSGVDSESSDSESSEETENVPPLTDEGTGENDFPDDGGKGSSSSKTETKPKAHSDEDFATWQRIIRLDAVRANDEWVVYSPSQAAVSLTKAQQLAEMVGLKDYEHLEASRIYHAARLCALLEAYALYDPEIGYCQGMSDLLSPIIAVMEEDYEAFWCFICFMKKARHNFRLDEVGIRRQLSMVSKIIKCKDINLYRHLEKLEAEDCFFVYRMVVVLFRRELTFEQTLCLWEVMWADQAAIRAGIAKSTWGRIRLRAPPTDDLLLYAIAAGVLQRRKQIIERYSSMDEIMRECHCMAGNLDVWKLLDDAHDLVVNLHEKI